MTRLSPLFTVLLAGLIAAPAFGQGLIVDRRPEIPISGSYQVKAIAVDAKVQDQVAEVQVSQTFHNPGRQDLEVEYWFPLPHDGAVQSLMLLVDGKEYPGKIMKAEQARQIYESIVRQKRDPALLEYLGQGLFKTSVFPIAPGKSSTVTLRYSQVLPRDGDVVRLVYPMGTHKVTGKPVKDLTVNVRIDGREPIKSIYSPTHVISTKHVSETSATVSMEQHDISPEGDFRLLYTLEKGQVGAAVLSYRPDGDEDGYFLVLASPGFTRADRKPAAKTVIFVIDKSGSMSGKKIEQAREAAKFVIRNLNEGDTFNIIAYDDQVESFKPEPQGYDKDSRQEAEAFVGNIRAGGSTNIDQALTQAMDMIQDQDRPSYVLFLTDGLPTAGEQNEMKIAEHVQKVNDAGARLINFGVGFDVNARLLDRLATGNGGISEYVKPDADIEAAVARFSGRLTAPVLSGIEMNLADVKTNRSYPRQVPDLFEGGQIVWVGRYQDAGKTTLKVAGRIDGKKRTFDFPATLAGENAGSAYAFVERLWAVRRVGHLIDQIDLHGRSDELINELVGLSTEYGILTPYTSFLADDTVELRDVAANTGRAFQEAEALGQVRGQGGVGQRAYKQAAKAATNAPAAGEQIAYDAAGNARVERRVRNVGNRTFFYKEDNWLQSDLDADRADKARVVEQYSDAYFELVRNLSREEQQYVANFREDVTVELNGQVYRVVQAR